MKGEFILEFLKEKKQVGAVAPSSKFLCRKMCGPIDFEKADVIVELGPGTGVLTKVLLARMKSTATLISIEANESFCAKLKDRFSDHRLKLINDSAENIGIILSEHGFIEADYIVSSLPLTVIPLIVKNRILDQAASNLAAEGTFIQFQYSLNAQRLLKRKFDVVKLDFTPINVPPAFVYQCRNLQYEDAITSESMSPAFVKS